MARKKPVTELDPPELTEAEFAQLRPAREVLSPEQYAAVTGRRRPRAAVPKVPVTIRLDREVVEAFKATGKGWQTKINDTLRRSSVTGRFVAARHGKGEPSIAVDGDASAGPPRKARGAKRERA